MMDSVKFAEQRVLFEEWCKKKALLSRATNARAMAALLLQRYENSGVYINATTRRRWKAWIASAQANGVDLQSPPESASAV